METSATKLTTRDIVTTLVSATSSFRSRSISFSRNHACLNYLETTVEHMIFRWFCCMKTKCLSEVEAALYASAEVRLILCQFQLQKAYLPSSEHQ